MVATANYYRSLNNFYITRSGLEISRFSEVNAVLKPMSQFKSYDDIKLPFVISGRLVTSKKYKDRKYGTVTLASQALKPSLNDWVGIKIYKSHEVYEKVMKGEDVSVDEVAGKIISTSWNDKDQGIDFVAEIYDKSIAYKMDAGVIEFVSVGFARNIVVVNGEYFFVDIEPKEASLVFDPRDSDARFTPVVV